MKYALLIISLLTLAGCTSSNDSELREVKAELRETKLNLNTCQNRLDMYTNTSSNTNTESNDSRQEEPEQPAEPQCEDVDYQILTQNGKKLDTCLASEVTETACGVQATSCESGQGYSCLRDISYKTVSKKHCE